MVFLLEGQTGTGSGTISPGLTLRQKGLLCATGVLALLHPGLVLVRPLTMRYCGGQTGNLLVIWQYSKMSFWCAQSIRDCGGQTSNMLGFW